MRRLRSFLLLGTLCSALFTAAQDSTPMTTQFDFWIGQWDLTWADGGKGTNTITKEMNGHVVHEHFADPATNYHGESWSMWDAPANKWKQTWVDDQGNYMAFEGGQVEDRMELSMHQPDKKTGEPVLWRMVFFNITPNAFDWEWRSSPDEGKTWELKWAIHYVRRS
ncbi:MAG: hypothetical protein WAU70_01200 [Flavobacteriales bacterium]